MHEAIAAAAATLVDRKQSRAAKIARLDAHIQRLQDIAAENPQAAELHRLAARLSDDAFRPEVPIESRRVLVGFLVAQIPALAALMPERMLPCE
jgi:hypothetical protein